MNDNPSHICNWCNQPSVIVWVHGHGQCFICGINIDECCRGEEAHQTPDDIQQQAEDKDD